MFRKFLHFLKDSLISSERNGHHPFLFRRNAVAVVIALVLLIEALFIVEELIVFRKSDFLSAVLPAIVMSLTNGARAGDNLSSLSTNQLLVSAAQKKAHDMARRGYFSHVSPEGNPPWYWLDSVGYNYRYAGENLAVNFTDSKELVDSWLNSPAHRANILKEDFTEIGIGMATGTYKGRESVFVVEFFGSPLPVSASAIRDGKPEVANEADLANVSPDTPAVFGTSTTQNYTDSSRILESISSPSTLTNNLLSGMAILLFGLILISTVYNLHFPRPAIIAGGLSVTLVILGVLLLNNLFLFSGTDIPTDTQSASVIKALK